MSKLKSITTFVDLKGSIAHVDLKGQVTHVNLQLTDLYLNPDTLDRILADSISYTDILTYDIDKRADDVAYIIESHAIELSKPFTDSVGITESILVERDLQRAFSDSFGMAEVSVVSFSGSYNETVSVAEILTYAMQKTLTDTASMLDSPSLNPNLGKTDSVSTSDVFSRVVAFQRSFNDAISLDDRTSVEDDLATDVAANKDNIVSIADVLTYNWAKVRTDTFAMVETHAIDFTPAGFTDSFSFSDSQALQSSLVKSETFGFTDSEAVDTALGKEDTINFTDNETLSNSLSKSDSFSFTDAQTFSNAIGKTESLNITETHLFSFGKSAQDSATISESISILNANRQSVLNVSALNSNTLN